MTGSDSAPSYAAKGSQRWLQIAVNQMPSVINSPLRAAAGLADEVTIEWLSPIAAENFIEYRDRPTFERLGIHLNRTPIEQFWPARGPCWDGLARSSTGDIFLVEAKAHIGEMVSGRSRASETPMAKIGESLKQVQREIAPGSEDLVDWTKTFYQYANRLAHLHLLRSQNDDIRAHLVFVYFLNATDVKGPSDRAEYEGATKVIEHYLGVRRSKLSRYIHKIYVDVQDLPRAV